MDDRFNKRDRTARLLNLELILGQYPQGIDIKYLADKCGVSNRTAYRDLKALENELGVPIWEERGKRGITEGYFAPPIRFSINEAINIFFAARMLQNFSFESNQNIASTFLKLSTIVPKPLKKYIQGTIEYIYNKPEQNRKKIDNLEKLIKAWLSQQMLRINYQEDSGKFIYDRIIEIYYFEPIGVIHSGFIIAYCHFKKKIVGLHIDQIVGEVAIEPDTYSIPSDFNAMDYLDSIWEYFSDEEIETIKLRFEPNIYLTKFHKDYYSQRSQQLEINKDGSATMTLRVRNSLYFRAWLMGWGSLVEVLEPESLRNQMIEMHKAALKKYLNQFSFKDITDEQWNLIQPLLTLPSKTGRPRSDERQNINGILWVLRTGEKWSDIPSRYGSPATCNTRLKIWKQLGIWDRILQILEFSKEQI
jgi:predicted DNA-binding transcriptional regulator YafY